MFSRASPLIRNAIQIGSFKGVSNQTPTKWDIVAAVCIERLPLITPSLMNMQKEFKEYLNKVEFEKSIKSNHEVRHEQDLIHIEKLKKDLSSVELDEISTITAQDFEDASTDEFLKFIPASVETEADRNNDQTSLERARQSHLVLLVEQQLGKRNLQILPQGKHNDGETLRQTAERVLKECCGDNIIAQIYGNAPSGFYKYKYPEALNGVVGAKVFFFYARHLSGQPKESTQHKWLKREELKSALPTAYYSSVNEFLVEERS